MATHAPPSGPLQGVRVVDFCSFIAGSFAGMLMGDFGADVIKVEALGGDLCRHWGPWVGGEGKMFQGWNRNKRSLAVDLRTDAGRSVVHKLVEQADVVTENMRPGVTKKLQIDYESLREVNPRIIYASSSGFGSRGPAGHRPGYDPVLQTMGGSAFAQTAMSERPTINSVAVSDYQAAMLMLAGVNAALFHRERTGEGQLLETSLLQAVMSIQSHQYVQPLDGEFEGAAGIYPYRMFETATVPMFIAAGTDKFWQIFCETLGMAELALRPEYETNPQRVERTEELNEILEPLMRTQNAAELEKKLVDAGMPCAALRSHEEFFEHEQVGAMDMNPVVEHSSAGRLRVAGTPVHFHGSPGAIQRPAPRLGEHSRGVLEEAGYSTSEIDDLIRDGVVAQGE